MSSIPMSNARREQQKKARLSAAVTAVATGDEDARRKAVTNVVQVWLDRLQLISTITTFFAGIDGTILSFAITLTHAATIDKNQWSTSTKVLMASLVGSLIFHICAAITSFTASFVLIRYRLIDVRDHMPPRPSTSTTATAASPTSPNSFEKARVQRFESSPGQIEATHSKDSTQTTHINPHGTFVRQASHNVADLMDVFQGLTGTVSELEGRVFIHQVQFRHCFRTKPNNGMHLDPPVHLLSSCHSLSVCMALLGFALALLGILTFAWTTLPLGVAVFSSVCLGGCLFTVFCVVNFRS